MAKRKAKKKGRAKKRDKARAPIVRLDSFTDEDLADLSDMLERRRSVVGRPSSYRAEFAEQARKLTKILGATDQELAEYFQVADSTLNRWKIEHPEFQEALKAGKADIDERVEKSLYRMATGYTIETEQVFQYKGEEIRVPVLEHRPPVPSAAIFWLKNRRKDKWREKIDHSHEGIPANAPATIVVNTK